jgi:hypothetical protein
MAPPRTRVCALAPPAVPAHFHSCFSAVPVLRSGAARAARARLRHARAPLAPAYAASSLAHSTVRRPRTPAANARAALAHLRAQPSRPRSCASACSCPHARVCLHELHQCQPPPLPRVPRARELPGACARPRPVFALPRHAASFSRAAARALAPGPTSPLARSARAPPVRLRQPRSARARPRAIGSHGPRPRTRSYARPLAPARVRRAAAPLHATCLGLACA